MPANPTIYQRIQLGVQGAFGTAVPATRRLASVNGTFSPQTETNTYRPAGSRLASVVALNKEWSLLNIDEGALTYNEIVYLLSSLLHTTTPVGNGTSTPYVWTFELSRDGGLERTFYTVEHGSTARGRDIPDAMVSSMTFTFNRSEVTVTGEMIGNAHVDEQVLTADLPELDIVPVLPTQVGLKLALTHAGLDAAPISPYGFAAVLNLNNLSVPVWPLNQTAGFAEHVETLPEINGSITVQVDTGGMAPLAQLRDGSTLFLRIDAAGALLAGITPAVYNAMEIDVAMKLSGYSFSDLDGVYVAQWDFAVAYDPTWDNGCLLKFTNGLAAL